MNRNSIDISINQYLFFCLILIIFIFLFIYTTKKTKNIKSILIKKINKLENDYNNKLNMISLYNNHNNVSTVIPDLVDNRDRLVINDELYPPISRTERPIFDYLLNNGTYSYPTRGNPDTYRALGLAKSQKTNQMFILMGRQKFAGSSIGEFYLISTDKTNQFKLPLNKEYIRDYYNIPDKINLKKDNIMGDDILLIQEYKKSDLDSPYL